MIEANFRNFFNDWLVNIRNFSSCNFANNMNKLGSHFENSNLDEYDIGRDKHADKKDSGKYKWLYLVILIKIGLTYFIGQQNVNLSLDSFLNYVNSIMDVHAPLKKFSKYKLKFKTKPWITPALQKSISIKNNLLKKFITAKDLQVKERYHKEYKDYRNMISTNFKQSKTNYYNYYFEANWNSIKRTWKGIKSILSIKNISADIPKTFIVDGTTISNPMEISNIFNNYFSSIASKTKLNISFSHKKFSDLLKNRSNISFFVSPTDTTEIENVISSSDSNKSVGPNSIPTKILKLL